MIAHLSSTNFRINWLDWKSWAWLIGIFTLIELFEKIQLVVSLNESGYSVDVISGYLSASLFLRDFLEMYSIALLIPFFWLIARKIHLLNVRLVISIPANIALILATLAVQQVLFRALFGISNLALFREPGVDFFSYFSSWRMIQALSIGVYFVLLLGVFYGIDSYQRWREKELAAARLSEQLTAARLQALQTQLQPHFLFNVLQTTSALTIQDPQRAQKMLVKLGDLLRAVLDYKERPSVTLREEIQFIDSYLEIQSIRFGDRLVVNLDFPAETLDCSVPTLILQPLVENAVHHGLRSEDQPGVIEIGAKLVGEAIQIWVSDSGSGVGHESKSEGIGLSNVRDRLSTLYGNTAQLIMEDQDSGFRVNVILPA